MSTGPEAQKIFKIVFAIGIFLFCILIIGIFLLLLKVLLLFIPEIHIFGLIIH